MTLEQLNIISTYCDRKCTKYLQEMKDCSSILSYGSDNEEWRANFVLAQERHNHYYDILQNVNSQIDDFIKLTVVK